MINRIRKAAVIGSGVMGGGIAALLASAGIDTLLLDIVPPNLKDNEKDDPGARNRIVSAGLQGLLKSKPPLLMHPGDARRIAIGNLEDDFEKLADCDWIVEVVVENPKIKQALFQRIEDVRRPDTIVSTNTSGIPLKLLCRDRSPEFRQHFLGTHFFNPVRYMKLLEIIRGEETLPEVAALISDVGERLLGKGIVNAKDAPNFVANRIGVHGMARAIQLMAEHDLSIAEVDALFGPLMGRPKTAIFKTADLVGLDIMLHVAQNTYQLVKDDEQRDAFRLPAFVEKMVTAGLLGKKSGSGFYKTVKDKDGRRQRLVINPDTLAYEPWKPPQLACLAEAKMAGSLAKRIKAIITGSDKGAAFAWRALADNLVYAASRIPEITDSLVEIDNGIKWGFNFEMGPFETWDAIGVRESVARMEKEGIAVPDKVKAMLSAGCESFYRREKGQLQYFDFDSGQYRPVPISADAVSLPLLKTAGKEIKSNPSASLVDLGDGVFCCEFHTKMNALNGDIIAFLNESIDFVAAEGSALVIGNQAGGMPGAFSAGADLVMMMGLAMQKQYAQLEAAAKALQDVLQKAHYAPFPVVAAPYGLALGGGCEICLAADRIVAHAELYLGLVEVGVGLLPAGGGCLNLWKKVTGGIPEAVREIDLGPFFVHVFKSIATARVSSSAADARAAGYMSATDRIVFNRDHLIGEAKKEALKMAREGYAPPIRKPVRVFGEAGRGMANAELFNMLQGGFASPHDVLIAKKIAYVLGGGEFRTHAEVPEEVILKLERRAFADLWREEKTMARVQHMLKTGKPLRN
jgi:3-hydroxyacyl-CoA dehydrogenase